MAISRSKSNRKTSGGRYNQSRTKKKFELAGFPANTKLGVRKMRTTRVLGGNIKNSLLTAKEINVSNKGKIVKAEVLNVVENPANQNLVGRNILTKGAVVETKLGKVRITSRPGQEGIINGVLVA